MGGWVGGWKEKGVLTGPRPTMMQSMVSPAVTQDRRPRAPCRTLITVSPICLVCVGVGWERWVGGLSLVDELVVEWGGGRERTRAEPPMP